MPKTFADIIIDHLEDMHISDLRRIKIAIEVLTTEPEKILDRARSIRNELGTLHAVKFLREAKYPGELHELKLTVDSL